MISILSPSSEAFLANMARVQRTIDEASRQTSSGKRVNVASDAPGELDTILQLHTDETRNTQIQENLAVAKADADAADGALTSATQLMDRARVLAAQGATFTVDAAGRQSIAGEVQSLLEQMVAISRTTVQGRYIFGGDQDSNPPYAVDLTAASGVSSLTSSPATRQVENAAGGAFAGSQNAQEIFDTQTPDPVTTDDPPITSPAADNVFAALNNLRLGQAPRSRTQPRAARNRHRPVVEHKALQPDRWRRRAQRQVTRVDRRRARYGPEPHPPIFGLPRASGAAVDAFPRTHPFPVPNARL